MDLKGSLVDTHIHIIPSNKCLDFIKHLSEQNVPENIEKLIKGKYYKLTKNDYQEVNVKIDIELNDEEKDVLKKINHLRTVGDDATKIPSSSSIQDEVKKDCSGPLLGLKDIEWLYEVLKKMRENSDEIPYLHELLESSSIIFPENSVIKRNPELEARCVKLRAQQEARQYRAMTKGVDNYRMHFPEDTIAYQLKYLNRQLIAIGQFIISLFAGFLFGFLGVELMIGTLDFGFRLLLGVMCALIIALAEIYFLAKKLNEELTLSEKIKDIDAFEPRQKVHKKNIHQD